ncbi:hypothetical protein LTR53_020116, partial [Teratosphaeriaceae sp. CCFEE 6253]
FRRRWMANASLMTKMAEKKAMDATVIMMLALAMWSSVSNCSGVVWPILSTLNSILNTASATRTASAAQATAVDSRVMPILAV